VTHDQEEAMAVSDRIAVMHQGSVVQEGTAEDLYHRPASQFVAQFVGRMNLVAGRVSAIAGETASIAALGTLISAPLPRRDLAPGDPVQIIVRPEAIELVRGADEKTLSGLLHATIVSRTFLGEKIEYRVRCGDEMLQVVRYNAGPGALVPEGETVFLRLPADTITVLAQGPMEGSGNE
jgi:ABC-type Fe3+/spermidine/putrescine transport system ATPase subunit